jgi:serine protease
MNKLLLSFMLAFAALGTHAERTPDRTTPLPQNTATARVIVKFKSDAATLRVRALAADAAPLLVAQVLDERAGVLGARLGVTLKAGPAVGERVQVVTATGIGSDALAARLAADGDVEYAEADRRMRRLAIPSDTFYSVGGANGPAVGQWYLRAPAGEAQAGINAAAAWDIGKGGAAGAGTVVAVLDTGARFDHPDLAGKLLPGYDMVSDSAISNDGDGRDADASDPGDWVTAADVATSTFSGCDVANSSWHGTQVAGIVGAATDNGQGMAGTGWNARVLPVRVLGKCFGNTSDIATGIVWAAGIAVPGLPTNPNPARVINLSLGGDGACGTTYQNAINQALAAGVVVVAAAGNTAGHAVGTPANCTGVIGVAALRHVGTKVGYSDVGTQIAIAAPGGNCINIGAAEPCLYPILTTRNTGTTTPLAAGYSDGLTASVGTSFSSPLVAGTVGLMMALQPTMSPASVKRALQISARAFPTSGVAADETGPIVQCRAPNGVDQLQCYCTTATCGAGMLDAAAAVAAVNPASFQPRVTTSPAAPAAGETITLSSSTSTLGSGRTVATRRWALVNGGGIVTAFSGATDAETATLAPSGAGSFTVRLTLTDDLGINASTDLAVTVGGVVQPSINATPATPVAGEQVTLSSSGSAVGSGRTVASTQWLLVDAGTTAAAFTSATNAATATLVATTPGRLTVRLTLTDDRGVAASVDLSIGVTAVGGASPVEPHIVATPTAPAVGQDFTVSGGTTSVGAGRNVATWQWAIVSGGSTAAFVGTTTSSTATLRPTAAGSVTVRLTVTDDLGISASTDLALTVSGSTSTKSEGGGALSAQWLWLLALAAAAIAWRSPARASPLNRCKN